MSAPRICTRCKRAFPGFHSYQRGWRCDECLGFMSYLTRRTAKEQIEEAQKIIQRDMDETYRAQIEALEKSGEGVWDLDPQVDYVVVLRDTTTPPGARTRAWLVVYLVEADWEVSQWFEERTEA